jgi:hypothetical protein
MRTLLAGLKSSSYDLIRLFRYLGNPDLPILFANSFPKSGTNLMNQILGGLASITPFRVNQQGLILTFNQSNGRIKPVGDILKDLKKLYPGEIARGHVHAFPELMDYLTQERFINFFVLRDLRDVVVSHAFYVTELSSDHSLAMYYRQKLTDMDQRIKTSITGLADIMRDFPNINERMEPYLPWLQEPGTMVVRFEDLIHDRQNTLNKVLDHIINNGYSLNISRDAALKSMLDWINPDSSRTFRKGTTGDWQNHFTQDHKKIFKEIAGNLLIELGYEKDNMW